MNDPVTSGPSAGTAKDRKARGAFFTPRAIAAYVADWAIRTPQELILEPAAGDAAFMVEAVRRLKELGSGAETSPVVGGVEIHADSAKLAENRVIEAGGVPQITVSDFFHVAPDPRYSAIIGNPPFIRYQDFRGDARSGSQEAALLAGVTLSGLASSWAAFTVYSSLFLSDGGRMGLVLPAELLSVNYASPVRRFLFDKFRNIELVLFDEQVFPAVEADVVLLLADGFNEGPADAAVIRRVKNAADLRSDSAGHRWVPKDPAGKWTTSLVGGDVLPILSRLRATGSFVPLQEWGSTTLGMVTGNNRFFAMPPSRAAELDIPSKDLVVLSPPGSSHLRGLVLTLDHIQELGAAGKSTYLFRPAGEPTSASADYIQAGRLAGVDAAYKCRIRRPWYRVPFVPPADLLLTSMNADTARLTTNEAGAHHLNSVHGVYLHKDRQDAGRELLPLASLNSLTLLSAEMVGRSYGGGILKVEPREADIWWMPSPELVGAYATGLRNARQKVSELLAESRLLDAVNMIDRVLLVDTGVLTVEELDRVRESHKTLSQRRMFRSRKSSSSKDARD